MIGVNQGQLVIFTNQFASMLRSQLPLVQALDCLVDELPDRTIKQALNDIIIRVNNGEDFSRALAQHPHVFGPEFVSIAQSGMESGFLADAISRAASYLERVYIIQSKLRSAMIYPAFLVAGFIVIFHVLIFFVLPRFDEIFSQFSKSLPLPTRILIGVGDFYSLYWPIVCVALACAIAVALGLLAQPKWRKVWDCYKLRLPVAGAVWRLSALARFAHTMSLQIESSVSLVAALRVAAPATRNAYYSDVVLRAADDIEMGLGVAQSFAAGGLFSGAVYQMAVAGEQTGRLDEMFSSVASYFDNLWLQRMEGIAGIVNPLMTAIVGGAIAMMVVAAFLPVFNISGLSLG